MVGYTAASRHAAVLKRHINNEIRQKKKLDDYNENPTKCKMCDGFLSYGQSKSNLTYCCVGCANRNRKHTESTKIKIGNSFKDCKISLFAISFLAISFSNKIKAFSIRLWSEIRLSR